MKQHNRMITTAVAVLALLAGGAVADNEFLMHGRISFDTGTAMVKNTSEETWSAAVVNTLVMPGDTLWVDQSGTAELEMAGGTFLRLADGSKADLVSLPPNGNVRGWAGSFYIHRLNRSQGSFIFTAPSATLEIPADAMVRVDIDVSGAATVSVRWGSAKVRTDQGGEVTATENTRVWIDPGLLPSEATPFDRAQTDAFDDWNNERARLLVEGVSTAPKEMVIQDTAVGRYDLDRYGEWVYVDSRPYWRPTVVVDYVPYRHGYWNYMPAVGHVWVDEYPFAYVTTHYGRWCHTPSYGWLWSYDPVWSPAWVASVRVGDYYAWSPVDYYNRPVFVTGGAMFSLGGVSFCSYSTSYVRHSYLYGGPSYVYAPTTVIINTFNAAPPQHVSVWNIAHDRRSRPSVPFDSRYISGERDYNPRRSIRGAQGDWAKDFAPSNRVQRLEAGLGRTEFASAATRSSTGRSLRTASTEGARVAQPRQVRLDQTEQTYLSRSARTEGGAATSTRSVPESARLASLGERSGGTIRSSASGAASIRDGAAVPLKDTVRSASPDASAVRSGQLTPRSTGTTANGGRTSVNNETPSGRVALRDMESGVPSPRTSITPERTTIRSNSGTSSPRTSQPDSSVAPQRTGTPSAAPTIRRENTPVQHTTPSMPSASPTLRQSTPTQRSAPAPTPAPTVRRESAPIQRSAPAPTTSPTMRRESAPIQRSAPAPTPSPTMRRESAPIQRSAPAPAPSTRSFSAPSSSRGSSMPSVRSMPSPTSGGSSISPRSSMPSSRGSSGSVQRPSMPSGSSSRGRR